MEYSLNIKENAIDSFNEALDKYELGESGQLQAYKFAILNMAHFVVLLKQYLLSIDQNLVFSKCFNAVTKYAKANQMNLLKAHAHMVKSGYDFKILLNGDPAPHTVKVDDALNFSKCEKCQITGVDFVDADFCNDIAWMKSLRNNIEHFEFSLIPREVRFCIGRLVRSATEFADIFSLMNIADEVGQTRWHIFEVLSDEYSQFKHEAHRDVVESSSNAFNGFRPKEYGLVNWNVYECPKCNEKTMIPNGNSITGYRCTFPNCGNEESEEIEVNCEICDCPWPNGEMTSWEDTFDNVCPNCNDPQN